ncbi:hypothetical protein D9M71_593070 [compost metagenome]
MAQIVGVVDVGKPGDFSAGNIFEAHQTSRLTGLEHDVVEVCRLFETAFEDQVRLERLGRYRRLSDHPTSHLGVLRAYRRNDVTWGQVERRDPLRVQPDTHRVLAGAQRVDVPYPIDALERVGHGANGEVRHVQLIVSALG